MRGGVVLYEHKKVGARLGRIYWAMSQYLDFKVKQEVIGEFEVGKEHDL